MNKEKANRLIETSLPIKEISAESVRDKSIRHGHISTLHLWWARRPLPVCRAIVFASLVPDPEDDRCPQAFRDAVDAILNPKDDSLTRSLYSTYPDIPYTAVFDPMEDNRRNRLMMFIGKFSEKCQQNMKQGKSTPAGEQLSDGSLIKWENKNNPRILRMARELIWVAYHAERQDDASYETLHNEFMDAWNEIERAENALYGLVDRHIDSKAEQLQRNLDAAIEHFQNNMPSVFDPFAGGGAIPLEAARLGCRSYGNDINPVAHIIERGSAEFPQRYGKPITFSEQEFRARYGDRGIKMAQDENRGIIHDMNGTYTIPNRLSFDVEFYARQLLEMTEREVGHLYPSDEKGNKPIAYYWARTAKCSNPSCGAEVPLLKQFYLANTAKKHVYLNPIINGTDIKFEIKEGKYDSQKLMGWNNRGNLTCPCCGSITNVANIREQISGKKSGLKCLAVIGESSKGKIYSSVSEELSTKLSHAFSYIEVPQEKMAPHSTGGDISIWGFTKWSDMFTHRQLVTLLSLVDNLKAIIAKSKLEDYDKAIIAYLSILIDRISIANTSLNRWSELRETNVGAFSKQALSMTFDFPEANPFCSRTGSALNQLNWILRYIESESATEFPAVFVNASSGEKHQFEAKTLTAVVTDPPYYDAMAYADLSDFFYVWLKRCLTEIFPSNFSTPQTPKTEECTALKHYHNNSVEEAKHHFEDKLSQIFDAIEIQTSDIVSIMFAHQSTEAWTTLCNSILYARMNITGSWPIDTERAVRTLANAGAALESSVTVACRPSERKGFADFKDVKRDIEKKVSEEVESLYELGFRGADLLTACFGQAVSEFGRYKVVEKADGSEVSVGELLELARSAAFDALLKGVQGDDFTKFYIGWLQLNGTGDADFDDATKFTRVGVNVNIADIRSERLLIVENNKIHIAMAAEHIQGSSLGSHPTDSLIAQAHQAILLNRSQDRVKLLRFVCDIAPEANSPLWRLLATLKELLPAGADAKDVQELLINAEDLRQHCHNIGGYTQGKLFDFD